MLATKISNLTFVKPGEKGVMSDNLKNVFRRVFAPYCFPDYVVQQLGIKLSKYLIMYGENEEEIAKCVQDLAERIHLNYTTIQGEELTGSDLAKSTEKLNNLLDQYSQLYASSDKLSLLHILYVGNLDKVEVSLVTNVLVPRCNEINGLFLIGGSPDKFPPEHPFCDPAFCCAQVPVKS